MDRSRHYQANNAVEVSYKWRLHTEPDLGVPLAPSAMDLRSYQKKDDAVDVSVGKLHPDDEALLNWKGSLGDTSAENLKKRQDQLRAAARLALAEGRGRIPNVLLPANTDRLTSPAGAAASVSSRKAFSRVLDETMQSWMKKTTYLSNDYSRKVHDFKSLATTKQLLKQDLEKKQVEMNLRRSAQAIANTFTAVAMPPKHPTKKNLKPKAIMPVLPNVDHWGNTYTHVVIDKAPNLDLEQSDLSKAFIAEVKSAKRNQNTMVAQLWCPKSPKGESDSEDNDEEKEPDEPGTIRYRPVQEFDLDVVPLREEDGPHVNFCLWLDSEKKTATYLPLNSRIQLSTGRPAKRRQLRKIARQPHSKEDLQEIKEQQAEVDYDVAKEVALTSTSAANTRGGFTSQSFIPDSNKKDSKTDDFHSDSDSDGLDAAPAASGLNKDSDDDDSEDEAMFGGTKTIVAES